MKITGVIAEYNPFHNGHRHQLEEARKQTGADYILVVMNGDFMQRGCPSYWNKYTRAAMAVANGADAVIELPVLYGTASAEFFALGGVRLLHQLGGVQHLSFGCETNRLNILQSIASFLKEEPEAYRIHLNQLLSQGISFPKARAIAVSEILSLHDCTRQELEAILNQPNNILALEYMKALLREQSPITPVSCLRTDNGYHRSNLERYFSSATAIRKEYDNHGCTEQLRSVLPETVYQVLETEYNQRSPIQMEDFYPLLQYCLWKPEMNLTDYLDVSEDLANRIRSVYRPEQSYQEFVEAIVNKQYTYSRIYRCLLHILLDIRATEMSRQLTSNSMHYARLLAFRKESSPMLRYLQDTSSIPIITKISDGIRNLEHAGDSMGVKLLEQDIAAAHLYEQVIANRYQVSAINEYTKGVVIVNNGYF